MTFLSVRQCHEVSRFADRHGPASVERLGGDRVLVWLDDRDARRPTVGLVLASDGRVLRVARCHATAKAETDG